MLQISVQVLLFEGSLSQPVRSPYYRSLQPMYFSIIAVAVIVHLFVRLLINASVLVRVLLEEQNKREV